MASGKGGGAHHPSDTAVSNADPDLGLLRAPLGVGHTHDVRGVGGLDVAHRPRHGHVDLADAGAERRGEVGGDRAIQGEFILTAHLKHKGFPGALQRQERSNQLFYAQVRLGLKSVKPSLCLRVA